RTTSSSTGAPTRGTTRRGRSWSVRRAASSSAGTAATTAPTTRRRRCSSRAAPSWPHACAASCSPELARVSRRPRGPCGLVPEGLDVCAEGNEALLELLVAARDDVDVAQHRGALRCERREQDDDGGAHGRRAADRGA